MCGDGGMVLDIFSVDGEQGQGRRTVFQAALFCGM